MRKSIISVTILSLLIGCGGGSSSSSKGEQIDLADYFPIKSIEKRFKEINRSGKDLKELDTNYYTENITISNFNKEKGTRTITSTSDEGETKEVTVINEANITTTDEDNKVTTFNRISYIGSTVMSSSRKTSEKVEIGTLTYDIKMNCKLEKKLSEFEQNDFKYTGDILKMKCISSGTIDVEVKESLASLIKIDGSHKVYNVSYAYIKKDIGDIAYIDDNCIAEDDAMELANDVAGCTVTQKEYDFYEED
jgi:hypothetical protein